MATVLGLMPARASGRFKCRSPLRLYGSTNSYREQSICPLIGHIALTVVWMNRLIDDAAGLGSRWQSDLIRWLLA